MAVLVPVGMHGAYDFTAMMEQRTYAWLFFGLVVGMFLLAFILIRKLSTGDRYIR